MHVSVQGNTGIGFYLEVEESFGGGLEGVVGVEGFRGWP